MRPTLTRSTQGQAVDNDSKAVITEPHLEVLTGDDTLGWFKGLLRGYTSGSSHQHPRRGQKTVHGEAVWGPHHTPRGSRQDGDLANAHELSAIASTTFSKSSTPSSPTHRSPMRIHSRTTTTALTLALVLGGCGSGKGEPTDSTSTASGPSSSSTNEDQKLQKSAESAFKRFWEESSVSNPSKAPSDEVRDLMTEEAYQREIEFAESVPKVRIQGKDALTATSVKTKRSAAGSTASVEVCYTVHQKLILLEDVELEEGKTLKKGEDLRSDQDGRPIKAGTEMVNLVTMKRGRQENDPWRVDSTQAGYKKQCSVEGKTS